MPQYKTLQFPNTAAGQANKVRTLEREAANGWRIVSETIVAGKFKGEKACCFFLIFAPCAFLAGNEPDMITITLEKADSQLSIQPETNAKPPPTYDRNKWNALTQYDADISAAVDEVIALGPKWEEELAAAYMAISDKNYLGPIVAKLKERAAAEAETKRQEQVRQAASAAAFRASEAASLSTEPLNLSAADEGVKQKSRIWIIALFVVIALLIVWLLSIAGKSTAPTQSVTAAPTPPVAQVSPSFDCSKVTAVTLKLICNTPDLAEADVRLAKAYGDAMARTTSKAILRREERAWIITRNNGPAEVVQLKQNYEQRIVELERYSGN